MKRIILSVCLIALLGCSKNEETTEQTFFVNVFTQYSATSDEVIASPSHVYLFEDMGKTIDKDKSYYSVYSDGDLTYTDGTTARYQYKSPTTVGINNFENIPNGKYILFVCYVSYGYVDGCSSKSIVVNYDYRATTEKKVFLYGKTTSQWNYGYQDWDEQW
jgi:hypothetical protein